MSRYSAIVTGPHSSGTRITARMIQASGRAVLHYTYPLAAENTAPLSAHPATPVIWVRRHHVACAASMVRNGHAADLDEARAAIAEAEAARPEHAIVVRYEAHVADPQGFANMTAKALGFTPWKWPTQEAIFDGNAQYLKG